MEEKGKETPKAISPSRYVCRRLFVDENDETKDNDAQLHNAEMDNVTNHIVEDLADKTVRNEQIFYFIFSILIS